MPRVVSLQEGVDGSARTSSELGGRFHKDAEQFGQPCVRVLIVTGPNSYFAGPFAAVMAVMRLSRIRNFLVPGFFRRLLCQAARGLGKPLSCALWKQD